MSGICAGLGIAGMYEPVKESQIGTVLKSSCSARKTPIDDILTSIESLKIVHIIILHGILRAGILRV